MKKLVIKTSLLLSGLAPGVAFAQNHFDPQSPSENPPQLPQDAPESFKELIDVIVKIGRWMFAILMALGIVFVLYAAFLYLVAQGDDTKITTAKKVLIYSIVALVVGVLAGGVSVVVQDFLTS